MKSTRTRQPGRMTNQMITPLLGAVVLFAGFVLASHAANAPKPACPDTIEVGYPPDGLTEGGKRGINLEVMDALSNRSGCRFRATEMTASRAASELERGTLHMAGGRWFQTPEREKIAWFAHFQATRTLAITRADDPRLRLIADLQNDNQLVIGRVPGFRHNPTIDAELDGVARNNPKRLANFRDRETLFMALQLGRVDVIFLPREVQSRLSARLGTLPVRARDLTPNEKPQPGGLMLSRTMFSHEEAEKWLALVHAMCLDGTILSIFRRYFDASADDLACHHRVEERKSK